MQTALIREYPKSVDLHTPSRLYKPLHTTGIEHETVEETTGSARPSLHTARYASADRFLVLQYEGG
jgi:hypothetical protein